MLKQVPYHLHTWRLNRTDQRPRAWGGQNGSMWANCLKRKFYKGLRHWCSVLHLVLSLQRGDPAHNRVGWEGGKLVGQKVPPITLWQKGSLWRGLGPCRDLFGVLRPYWYFRVPFFSVLTTFMWRISIQSAMQSAWIQQWVNMVCLWWVISCMIYNVYYTIHIVLPGCTVDKFLVQILFRNSSSIFTFRP